MGEAIALARAAVRVVAESRVTPVPAPADNGSPVKVKLSFLDAPWMSIPPIQHVFLYDLAGGSGDFPAAVTGLKESLATVLAQSLLLAGKLAYVAGTGDVVVDCSDAGVRFVEAERLDGADMLRRLAGDEAHDVPAFLSLVPEHDARVLPAPAMVVQATRLGAAGLALGLSGHHAVADGRTMNMFIGAWAAACRRASPAVTRTLRPADYGRQAVSRAHPRGDELARDMLKAVAPNLPVANGKEDYFTGGSWLARRTFFFSGGDIRSLKLRIATPKQPAAVSRFVALLALSWTAFARAKGLASGDVTHLLFQADLRARLRPPVGDGYVGNCFRSCLVSADAGELLAGGGAGLLHATRAIQAAVREVEAAPLAGMETWIERRTSLPPARLVVAIGDPLFRVYETSDFGFGRPARVEPVSMRLDGFIVFRGGRHDGEVQISVALAPAHMDAFRAHFNNSRLAPKM